MDLSRLIAQEVVGDPECGGILALPVADTLKSAGGARRILATPSREGLWQAQTPQMFRAGLLGRALQQAASQGVTVTDEASAVEALGLQPLLVPGSSDNFKVTLPGDLALAEAVLQRRQLQSSVLAASPALRVGQGFDVHVLCEGRPLIIGGVNIPYARGLLGHSDADVLLHALIDALLGAAALGDIGRHFPDTDARWQGADSRVLLRQVLTLLRQSGFAIVNIDATIIAEQPKMAPHIPAMLSNVAADLGLTRAQVNIKAKTFERIGALGRGEGIAVEAIAMLEQVTA
jgi:2-C-methyl-D-erythritol 4-phosphate cytidylyltransferase/2-C-methyl-D-erythritol 2,4-cyclodiphosphate synthase